MPDLSKFWKYTTDYALSKIFQRQKTILETSVNWQEQYDAERECYNDNSLLDDRFSYAKHPNFIRILARKGIIKIFPGRTHCQILSRNYEAVIYRIWQTFYKYEYSSEEFFNFFLSSKGKPFDKKTIRYLSKHTTELTEKIWTPDFEEELTKIFNHK